MAACNWPVNDARRCRRSGSPFFSDLMLCWQHQRLFLDELTNTCARPEDRHGESIRDAAQTAFIEVAHAGRRQREAVRRASSLVYFVERDGFVKIGYSSDLKRRIQQINTGSCLIEGMTVGPVELLATIDGAGKETEDWLHRRFEHLRVGGEWFLLDEELRTFISGLRGCRLLTA